jgi:hypothetical protein
MSQGTLLPVALQQPLDDDGQIIPGALFYLLTAGTSTPATLYADVGLTVPLSNPVVADAAGRFPEIFMSPGQSVTQVLKMADGKEVWSAPNVLAVPDALAGVEVPALAGEDLGSGNGVYLSDGSGSKTPGRWYLWDTAHDYSSTLPIVGLVVSSNISAGQVGSVRIAGQVTGFNGLGVGQDQCIGAIGQLQPGTSTRYVGRADSATSIVLAPNQDPLSNIQSTLFALTAAASSGWIVVPFDAANFTASAGTWTLVSGDVLQNRYAIHNKTLLWNFAAQTTTVSSTPISLRIQIPTGMFFTTVNYNPVAFLSDNGTQRPAHCTPVDSTHLGIFISSGANFAAATDTTSVFFTVSLELA